ncbi:aminotransferase class V-fold PLP-dependent enzyme [Aquimarina gracilis]|uniref:Aminotransferase class V-fold PLP-dependent enzyme n=1 Tax=Aquimarina gracilis TaxID=874422 RepID=A0ABU5ZR48_9FLAO|nr:aminotransferase class V-fold PLP-dependent enzyme [Aquimarina gracilis]MEB3344517.1 aminotransferase class V-fold PLP-dependent enzyme [Aquimarina gracilis]
MEHYFEKYHDNIIGQNQTIKTPYHDSIRIIYTDWTASGRMYKPIEERMLNDFYPFVANTHTDTNDTAMAMTYAYHKARQIIKNHVNASIDDVLISSNSGMTGVINKLQRILGLRIHESFKDQIHISEENRPVVFISHMEHHSNQTSWLETIADVVIIPPDESGLVSIRNLEKLVHQYKNRNIKIAAITSCSNVTGIITPYIEVAELIHQYNGLCFVDFACSAPYINIDMHENDKRGRYFDAIYFSCHKFLGGPGTTGILVFNKKLYKNLIPDISGGGTVSWTNPWGEHKYFEDIEAREDGGTPAFLQTIKAAMCMKLKDEMNVEYIREREDEILSMVWKRLDHIPNLHILAREHKKRLGVISFYIDSLHHNLGVKLLNDRFGIQTRGGCSCAGTYGHYLLKVTPKKSHKITNEIDQGNYSNKPGWIRMSIHPTHTNQEIEFVLNAIKQLAAHHSMWSRDYDIDLRKGSIKPKNMSSSLEMKDRINKGFVDKFSGNVTPVN